MAGDCRLVRVGEPEVMLAYGSICSGVECFGVAVRGLPFRLRWVAEVDPFCSEVLASRYPGVRNYGDITEVEPQEFECVNVIVGGTPCQSFSVQGRRRGMDDARGRLAIRFGEIVAAVKPSWIVWENVPGVLTSSGGHDFAGFIDSLGQCGYQCAWRVLDARYFGVPQRRRRVFVVGHRGRWECAAAVLFDYRADQQAVGPRREVPGPRIRTLFDPASGRVAITGDETPKHGRDVCPTLRAQQGGEGVVVSHADGRLRKATVTEWERLQGLPDGYTGISGAGESARKKAIGNGFAVPVVRWIAERLSRVEELAYGRAGGV